MEELGKVVNLLRQAYTKLLIAERFRRDRRVRNELLMVSAMTGLPVLPQFMSNVYLSSALSDLKKAYKKLEKISSGAGEEALVARRVMALLRDYKNMDVERLRPRSSRH